jgi:endonuclease III
MYEDLEWKRSVSGILLNRVQKQQADQVAHDFFLDYPTPQALAGAREDDLRNLLYPLGMARTRARRLISFATEYLEAESCTS